ncbi:ABC transporter ATP-binding protein [Catenuloplanes atrovinosus]|uniref:NitT/TauT family transport system ATP-binding protein n=1 Tax=Catenuloplanes atrovinosus TaxID=137266 RepID=A0AAE3YM22_9ACTN|nr:ABC transporter ATP-binding protein [Catenuloplanes atrovinosus]MDR7274997.1 NitT/TauT family transport system ATP-binding protein [Catenuloplanes atrovinosus]
MSTATATVELADIAVSFPANDGTDYTAVADIRLCVEAGTFVSVVGPTGCGKTTLLNAIAGLLTPSSGKVLIDGEPLRGLNERVGYLFQQEALLPWKNVLDNVAFGLQLRGIGRAAREAAAREWIRRVGLTGFERAYPHQLSGGMRKRVAVAQTFLVDPDILLMDEPFGALDVQTRQIMENELLELWTGSGKTVIFVTHDLDEAVSLSDEVVLLSAGPASHIVGRYPIDLPRPRDLMDLRARPEITEIYARIWADLREEVMKGYERSSGYAAD